MLLKAAPGLKVPKENKPREYITDAKAVEVPESVYYRRAVAQGDLVPATPESDTAPAASAPAKSGKKE